MTTTAGATRRSRLAVLGSRAGSITAPATLVAPAPAELVAASRPTEAPRPALELDEGAVEIARTEVRPQRRRDPELRVGDLPQEKVRHAHLAAGADEQVGIGDVTRVEGGTHVGFRNGCRCELAGLDAGGQRPHRLQQLGGPA